MGSGILSNQNSVVLPQHFQMIQRRMGKNLLAGMWWWFKQVTTPTNVTEHQRMRKKIEPLYTMAILDVLNMINDLS